MGTEFVDKVREYLLSIGEDVQGVCVIERYFSFVFSLQVLLQDLVVIAKHVVLTYCGKIPNGKLHVRYSLLKIIRMNCELK